MTRLAGLLLAILGLMVVRTTIKAWPIISNHGATIVTSSDWSPARGQYGALAFIYGTLLSSAVAVVVAVPCSLGIAFYLNEAAPAHLRRPLIYLVELLAAVPSVVYGLWGFVVLVPFLANHVWSPLNSAVGWVPFLGGPPSGVSIATAGLVLAIMIMPDHHGHLARGAVARAARPEGGRGRARRDALGDDPPGADPVRAAPASSAPSCSASAARWARRSPWRC